MSSPIETPASLPQPQFSPSAGSPPPAPEVCPAAKPARTPRWYAAYVVLLGIWKFIVGVALTQGFLTSFVAAGWTYRAAQRSIHKYWWKLSRPPAGQCFCEFTGASTYHRAHGGWPNWILENNREWMRAHHTPGVFGKARRYFRTLLYSLWLNLKIGVQQVFNTCVLVIPGCALMLFSWYAGWLNSRHKGYEEAIIGPLTGIAGIILLIAAMYYVPMAQIRQASTGNWRAFYQWGLVWRLIRRKWLACFGLAVLYSSLAVPFMVIKTAPTFFSQNPGLAALSPDKALEFAKAYYFYSGFALFGIFLVLRLAAARIYASSLLGAVQTGAVTEEELAESEWETLHRLNLTARRPQPVRHYLVRTVAWCGTVLGRATVGVGLFLVWFTFISQVYISEFFMKSEFGRGWLNQPLVQLPWFNYIPSALEKAGKETAAD